MSNGYLNDDILEQWQTELKDNLEEREKVALKEDKYEIDGPMAKLNALKDDSDKLRFDLIPPEITEELAKVLTMGANKYADNSWQNVEPERYMAALFRHINSYRKGDKIDEESGHSHLSHALCNVAFLLWMELNKNC